MALWMAALAGALLAFLRFNFNPAKIFMGDEAHCSSGTCSPVRPSGPTRSRRSGVLAGAHRRPRAPDHGHVARDDAPRSARPARCSAGTRSTSTIACSRWALSPAVVLVCTEWPLLGRPRLYAVRVRAAGRLLALVLLVAGSLAGLWRLGFFRFQATRDVRAPATQPGAARAVKTSARTCATRTRSRLIDSMADLAPALKRVPSGSHCRNVRDPGWRRSSEREPAIHSVAEVVRARFR